MLWFKICSLTLRFMITVTNKTAFSIQNHLLQNSQNQTSKRFLQTISAWATGVTHSGCCCHFFSSFYLAAAETYITTEANDETTRI